MASNITKISMAGTLGREADQLVNRVGTIFPVPESAERQCDQILFANGLKCQEISPFFEH
jgi:hypothetical protein